MSKKHQMKCSGSSYNVSAIVLCLWGVLCLLSVSGCNSISNIENEKGKGAVKIFDETYEEVWSTASFIVKESKFEPAVQDRSRGTLTAQIGKHDNSPGEIIAIFVNRVNDSQTKVEVVSRVKGMKGSSGYINNWEMPILNELSDLLY